MDDSKEILTELQEIAPFLGREKIFHVPYSVPSGYFTDFAGILIDRIHYEADGFSDEAFDGISSSAEIAEISPLLAGLQKKDTYQTPAGYFEAWKVPVSDHTSTENKGFGAENTVSGLTAVRTSVGVIPVDSSRTLSGVIPINDSGTSAGIKGTPAGGKRTPVRRISMPMRVVRYAAAACIIGLLGIVAYQTAYRRPTVDPINALTTVSDQDMATFLDVSDVHWTPDNNGTTSETASLEYSDNEIHDLFNGVPDVELEEYSNALPEQKRTVN